MLSTLILTLEYYCKACQNAQDKQTQRTFFDQAFGAAQYHIVVFPKHQEDVENLWNDYKSQFEKIIYGWG